RERRWRRKRVSGSRHAAAGAWKVRRSLPHPPILRAFQQPAKGHPGAAKLRTRVARIISGSVHRMAKR
ncbi:hypothetical protein, partial [Roseicella aerolata]